MDVSARHQWGPAPSGTSRHESVCRRCALREVTDWYQSSSRGQIEMVTWVTPLGDVLGRKPVDSHQGPPRSGPARALDPVPSRPAEDAIAECPGDPRAWADRGERLTS